MLIDGLRPAKKGKLMGKSGFFASFTFLIGCFLTACVNGQGKEAHISNVKPVQVILMAGQSNMQGAGDFDEIPQDVLLKLESVKSQISISHEGELPVPVSYRLSSFHLEKYGFEKSFGPELSLAVSLGERYPDDEFLLIKTARGGTSLYGAWAADWSAEKAAAVERGHQKQTTPYYALHMEQVQKALRTLEAQGREYEISAALWLQGENDAGKEVAARSYEENLKQLVQHFRIDTRNPELPFVIGQINSTYGRFKPGPEMVRAAMVGVASSDSNVAVIQTSTEKSWTDFPKHSDNVHYNTEGQIRWGKAFARELVAMQAFD